MKYQELTYYLIEKTGVISILGQCRASGESHHIETSKKSIRFQALTLVVVTGSG
jgi:hypothetical protein